MSWYHLCDILVQEMGLKWVVVIDAHDNYARTPALQLEGTTINIFPLTMNSKRVERGEEVDVYQLLDKTKALIIEMKKNGM